jgi:phosphatidylglycerophosphatase A
MNDTERRASSACPKPILCLATGFGLGLSPVAPGTAGALIGVALAGATAALALWGQIVLSIALTAVAIPICGLAERHFGSKDDKRIVADEYMTFPLCAIGLPILSEPWVLGMAFVTNRLFDVIKPPPARGMQKLSGGWGVVGDDFFSALYALAVNHAIYRLFHHLAAV